VVRRDRRDERVGPHERNVDADFAGLRDELPERVVVDAQAQLLHRRCSVRPAHQASGGPGRRGGEVDAEREHALGRIA